MNRRALIWAGFAGCVLLLVAAVGAVTWMALRSDAGDRRARADAERAAELRLALWRADSTVQALLAREGARPPVHYLATDGSSPLTTSKSRGVLLHFDVAPDGSVVSPEAVSLDVAAALGLPMPDVKAAGGRLAALRTRVKVPTLQASLEEARMQAAPREMAQAPGSDAVAEVEGGYAERMLNIANATAEAATLASIDASAGPMTPTWYQGELLLLRRARVGDQEHLQGALLDWPALQVELRQAVAAQLPEADLVPAGADAADERRMAALPLVLYPGPDPRPAPRSTSLVVMLMLAWAGVLAAAGAGGALLGGTLRLGDRRAAFVAAVTHELRTPLTTLTTYAEMLGDERLRDEDKRKSYLATMQREAGRLGALVDNVLAYSRIERGRPGLASDALPVATLFERLAPRLRDRAAAAKMELVIEPPPEGAGIVGDEVAVDQILFNLVDNACKHAAAAATDRTITVTTAAAAGRVTFTVRDRGPGIPEAERRQIFAPFRRAKSTSGPGVGLGLALCRRLARHMDGDLTLAGPGPGAAFELVLRSSAPAGR